MQASIYLGYMGKFGSSKVQAMPVIGIQWVCVRENMQEAQSYLDEESHEVLSNLKQIPAVNHCHTCRAKFSYALLCIYYSDAE